MLQAFADKLDEADPVPGRFEIYTGPLADPPGDPIGAQVLLGTIFLSLPCGVVADGVLTLDAPVADNNVASSGTMAWGRALNGNDVWLADFDIGLVGSGTIFELNELTIYQGGIIRINFGTFTLS